MYKPKRFSILDTNIVYFLKQGSYHIDVVGGFGITPNNFKLLITNSEMDHRVTIKKSKWPVQSFMFDKRTKRYCSFDIPVAGNYRIDCLHPHSLNVKKSNLPIFSSFFRSIPTSEITLYLYLKY